MSDPAHESPAQRYVPSADKFFESSLRSKPGRIHLPPSQFLSRSVPRFAFDWLLCVKRVA